MTDFRKLESDLNTLAKKVVELKQKALDVKTRWWIGDQTSTETLINKVQEVISNRPRTLQELHEMTGASRSRISGAIVRLQVNGLQVQNLGTKYRALWWLPSGKPQR